MSPSPTILSQREGSVLLITLNRPHKLNALTGPDLLALQGVLDATAADDGIRAVIMTGAGERAFCAGMDVSEFEDKTPAQAHAFIRRLKGVCDRLRRLPQPVIMAINGHCIGGALEMAMAADLRVAASDAQFSMPEINLGIPSVLDAIALQKYVGLSLAKEMLLLGEPFGVAQINHSGFINRVVPAEQVLAAAREYADAVVQRPAATLAQQKQLFETWQNIGFDAASADSTRQFALAFASDVPARQLAVYQNKRAARKRGGK